MADPNTAEPTDTSVNAVGPPKPPAKKAAAPGSKPPPFLWVPCSKHLKQSKQTDMDYHIDSDVTNSTLGSIRPVLHAMTPIGRFWVSLRVACLLVVVVIRVAVAVRAVVVIGVVVAARAKKGEKERCTGADASRSAHRSPIREKKTSGTPLTLRWLSFLGES